MPQLITRPVGRLLLAAALLTALFAFGACGDLAATLPPRPTPAPTLARLPSVTPVTPPATLPPSVTPAIITTPTAVPLFGTVAVAANVRAGPGTDFAIIGVLDAGAQVLLLSRSRDWYQVTGPNAVAGWMSGQVLEVDPATAATVPEDAP